MRDAAALIAELSQAGISGELLGAVAVALTTGEAALRAAETADEARRSEEAERLAIRRSQNAERQARFRAKNNDSNALRSVTTRDERYADFAKDGPQTPKKTTNQDTPSDPKGSSAPRGSRSPKSTLCPEDFEPSPEHFAKAAGRGFGKPFVQATRDRMFRWSHANARRPVAKKSDWSMAFHGFLDRAMDEAPVPRGQPPPFVGKPNTAGDRAEFLQLVKNGGRHAPPGYDPINDRSGRTIEHQGGERPDREVPRPPGGDTGEFPQEGLLRLAGPFRG